MHHATTAVLWLQCPISFILCCVHVWANLMPCGHQNSNLGLSPGYDELHVATGWALNVAQWHGPGWELEFWCPWLLRIVACMWWNLSTWSRQTKSYKLWHNSKIWAKCGNCLGLCGCYGTWLQMRARCECKRLLQIAVRTICNLSTSKLQTECHIHAEIWPITGIWPTALSLQDSIIYRPRRLLLICTSPV